MVTRVPDEDGVQRVRRLLESLPGVRVEWAGSVPGKAWFTFAVSDARTLARLVHLGCAVNVPLMAGIDELCDARYEHDDPGCIRYTPQVPVTPADGTGTGLGLVEQLLIEEVRRLCARPGQQPIESGGM